MAIQRYWYIDSKRLGIVEDGSITNYDVQFENKLVKSIPANMLEVVKMQEHKHEVDTGENEEDE